MSAVPDTEAVKKLLSKTIATICREMIDFRVKITIEGLLSIVVDETKVVNVSVQEMLFKDREREPRPEASDSSYESQGSRVIASRGYAGLPYGTADNIPRAGPWVGAGPSGSGRHDDASLCRGNGDCIIKNFGCSLVASVASMAEAVSRVSRKPCCSGSASDISRLVDITNDTQSSSSYPSSTIAFPLTPDRGPSHIRPINIRPEDIQWPIRLPKVQTSSQAPSPGTDDTAGEQAIDFSKGESSFLSSSATSTQSLTSSNVSVASPLREGSVEPEKDSDDEDMLCSEGLNCCRLYSDVTDSPIDKKGPALGVPEHERTKSRKRAMEIPEETQDSISDTLSEPELSPGRTFKRAVPDASTGGNLPASPSCCIALVPRDPTFKRATPYYPPVGDQGVDVSCGASGCQSSCACCANLAWMRHRDALRTRRCRAKRGLPVSDLDSPRLEPPSLQESPTRPCDSSCPCCQILQLRRANARMRRKMYYQKKRNGPPTGDL